MMTVTLVCGSFGRSVVLSISATNKYNSPDVSNRTIAAKVVPKCRMPKYLLNYSTYYLSVWVTVCIKNV